MKILKILFENINSLKGKHEIDFSAEPLSNNSLFAITGDTGSGKSTILDVICLALYNQIPRFSSKITKKEIVSTGAIITRNQTHASVTVVYACAKGTFQSHWSIRESKTGNLQDYEMEVARYPNGVIISDKKSEVPAINQKYIGLTYEQFIKSVMLAQGAFAEFLQIPKKERSALLEKITGTSIYRKIGKQVYIKNKELKDQIARIKESIEIYKKDILDPDTYHEIKEKNNFLDTQIAHKDKLLEDLKNKIQQKKSQIEHQETYNKTLSDLEKTKESLHTFEQDTERGMALRKHTELEPYLDDLNEYQNTSKTISNKETQLKELERDIKENRVKLKSIYEDAESLIDKPIDNATFESDLYSFRDEVQKLNALIEKKKTEHEGLKRNIIKTLKQLRIYTYDNLEVNLREQSDDLHSKIIELKNVIGEISIDKVEPMQLHHRKKKDSLIEARQLNKDYNRISEEKQTAEDEITLIKSDIETLPKLIKASQSRINTNTELLNAHKYNETLLLKVKSLEEHRKSLKDGEPCPLCGSIEHPLKFSHEEEENEIKDKIIALENIINGERKKQIVNNQKLTTAKSDFPILSQRIDKFNSTLESTKSQIEAIIGKYENHYPYDRAIAEINQQIQSLEDFEKYHNQKVDIDNLLPIIEESNQVKEEKLALSKDLKSLYKGDNIQSDVDKLIKLQSETSTKIKALNDNLEKIKISLSADKTLISDREGKLMHPMSLLGYKTISESINNKLTHDRLTSLKSAKNKLDNKLITVKSNLKLLKSQLEDYTEEVLHLKLDESQNSLSQIQASIKEMRVSKSEIYKLLSNHEDKLEQKNILENKISNIEKSGRSLKILNEMIGDATGSKFNDYAQELTLNHLLSIANLKLSKLSDRYIIDQSSTDEDDSLTIIDRDMGNQRRSVKTLSGGETFIVSLSLALALSDFSSKDVEINSLFIDEGFGTLDAETLDKTIDTLERLQAESKKMIGIISHVPTLKERITTQIQLSKNGQGYSSITIV